MANRYFYRIPYSCTTYGDLTGFVVAENEAQAIELIQNGSVDDEEYSNEDSENYNYDYDNASFHVRESDIEPMHQSGNRSVYPKYFLSEVNLI